MKYYVTISRDNHGHFLEKYDAGNWAQGAHTVWVHLDLLQNQAYEKVYRVSTGFLLVSYGYVVVFVFVFILLF